MLISYQNEIISIEQIDVSFSRVCPVIDHEFRHNIVKDYFDNVVTKFIVYCWFSHDVTKF